jgi:hypothetical protein
MATKCDLLPPIGVDIFGERENHAENSRRSDAVGTYPQTRVVTEPGFVAIRSIDELGYTKDIANEVKQSLFRDHYFKCYGSGWYVRS